MFGDAQAYERFMGRWSALLAPRLLDVVGLGEPRMLVDVGCGTGNLSLAAAARWPACRLLGVDPTPGFVAQARDRTDEPDRVRFELGVADDLPLADGSADATLALLVLNFVPDPDRALAEMRRVTRTCGVLGAAVWDYGGGMGMLRTLWDAAARLDPEVSGQDEATMPLGRPAGLAGLWRHAGLGDVADGDLEVSTVFASFDDYWQPFLGGTGPAGVYVTALPDAGRAALRAELLDTLGPGPFELTAKAWWVRGTVPA